MPGNLALRYTVFVQKQGTDAAGTNIVGAPDSRLTITAALADLAANYPTATAAAPHVVAVGPGTYTEAGIVLPPFTFINGECDGEGQPTTILSLSASVTLASTWSINATKSGGIANVTIRAASGTPALDFTMPVPLAGNPSRTIILENVRHNLTSEIFEATSTADALRENGVTQDGVNTDTFSQIGGSSVIHNRAGAAVMTIRDKTSFAASGTWRMVSTGTGAGITANSIAAAGTTLRLTASNPRTLVLAETAPGVIAVSADAASIPTIPNLSFTGTAVSADLLRISDANGEGYTPTTPANWPGNPTTVQAALDQLGAGGGASGVPANGDVSLATNTTGDTTATPTAHNYFATITIGGAARTSNLITAIPATPTAGDICAWLITMPATAAIVLNMRNATAAGTILATYTTDGINLAWLVQLEYRGGAWTLWSSQIAPSVQQILVTKSTANAVTNVASVTAPATTALTLQGGTSGASAVMGQGANASVALTTTGTSAVEITTGAVVGDALALRLNNGDGSINNAVTLRFNPRGAAGVSSQIKATGFAAGMSNLRFFMTASSVETEAMVLTPNGNLLLGQTADISGTKGLTVTGTTSSTSPVTGTVLIGPGGVAATNVGIGAGRITTGQTLFVLSGTNQKANTFVMVGGAATVANTSVTANSVILITLKTASGARNESFTITPSAGVGFTIAGGLATDNGTYNYIILEVS